MGKPDVSIIIVNYNHFQLLRNCIRSAREHIKEINYEIIVVDNASDEGDVDSVLSEFEDIKILRNDANLGFSRGNNLGVKISEAEYILFLNNDTVFTENSVKMIYDYAKSLKTESIIGIKLLNADGTMQESVYQYTTLWNSFTENFFLYKIFPKSKLFNKYYQNYHFYEAPVETGVVKGAFLFISKSAFNKLNGFDERFYFYGEELDLCYRFQREIGKIFYFPLTSIIHLGGASTKKMLWFKYKNQRITKIQFYQKHFRGIKFLIGICLNFSGLILRFPLYFLGGIFTFRKALLVKSYYYLKQIFIYPRNVFR